MDATLKAAQASVKGMIYEISITLNIYDAIFGTYCVFNNHRTTIHSSVDSRP